MFWLLSGAVLRTFFIKKKFHPSVCKTLAIVSGSSARLAHAEKAAQGIAGVPPHACDAVLKN